jgi:AcrR family transcriptional regulator
MRYPDSHKGEVRQRIVDAAARALRTSGIAGVSIPGLMKQAGMTHGGFYNHFEDRDALVAAALERAADDSVIADESRSLEGLLAQYLSEGHVIHPEMGCVVAALGAEASRAEGPTRGTFARVARRFIERVARKKDGLPKTKRSAPSDAALVLAAQMVGAIVLARSVDDPAMAARIVRAARRAATHVD